MDYSVLNWKSAMLTTIPPTQAKIPISHFLLREYLGRERKPYKSYYLEIPARRIIFEDNTANACENRLVTSFPGDLIPSSGIH